MHKEKPMEKKRVHELAKELNLNSKELIKTIKKLGIPVANHMSALEPHDVERVYQHYTPQEEKKVTEERIKPSVIRRRVERLKPEPKKEEPVIEEPIEKVAPPIEKPVEKVEPFAEGLPKKEEPVEIVAPPIEKPTKRPDLIAKEKPPEMVDIATARPAVPVKQPSGPVKEAVLQKPSFPPPKIKEGEPQAKEISAKEKQGVKPTPKQIQEARRVSWRKEKPKPSIEPAKIISMAETPSVAKEAEKVKKIEVRPKKKRVIIFEDEPRVEKFQKKGRKEAGALIQVPMAFRKRERKIIHGRKAGPISLKKPEIIPPKQIKRRIKISELINVGELSKKMGVKAGGVIKKLLELGVIATINQSIDIDTAQLISEEFGYEVEKVSLAAEEVFAREEDDEASLHPRPPVVTVMGHVDHGKTKLLDAIRETNVTDKEAGGITQHIGAYLVDLPQGEIVFIDTPGHEAFTAMRARGSQVTDIVVLVIAANEGVKEQTTEAINHARDARVPIIVAINKIDLPEANPEKIRRELAEQGLLSEEWGGDTIFVEISAKQKTNIDKLLEMILLQAEILELKANPNKLARGVIIESRLDKGQGPVATVLIQEGTLKVGDPFVSGQIYGKVRAMFNDKGKPIEKAGPAFPVEVLGFAGTPNAGDSFIVVSEERKARMVVEHRQQKERQQEWAKVHKVTLENLYDKIKEEELKELKLIIKADVHGSIEALTKALMGINTNERIKLNLIHSAVGAVNESDVMLASASNAIIIGFNVAPDQKSQNLASVEHVDIRTYNIIYDVIDDIKKAMEGLLAPIRKEMILGRAEVIQLFHVSKIGTIAGSKIVEGKMVRGASARLLRNDEVIHEGKISTLKRFKDDVKEALTGYECGIKLEGFNDIQLNDIIEAYTYEEVASRLE